jgi:lon-related putative ATP-dependent protease
MNEPDDNRSLQSMTDQADSLKRNDDAAFSDARAPAVTAVTKLSALTVARLYRKADLSGLSFQTTDDLEAIEGLVGQQRALSALEFGTRMRRPGFNLFVIGSYGARMQSAVESVLRGAPPSETGPVDWVYVNNFAEPRKPIAIQLPPGRAIAFRDAMHELIEDQKVALPAVFESEDYQNRRSAIDQSFQTKQGEAFSALRDQASKKSIVILRTPMGFALAPTQEGQVVPPDEFASWPEEKRREVQETIQALEKELEHIVRQIPQWEKARRDEIRKLNRETATFAVGQSIDEAKAKFADIPRIAEHLDAVHGDLINNVAMFVMKPEGEEEIASDARIGNPFERYEVNVLVGRPEQDKSVPIVKELHPTLGNLIGSIEYISQHGVLVTNFRLIKAGAIHRANGGFLLLDVRHLLMEPFSWSALKRTLRQREIRIEDVARFVGLTSTVSLEPDPIPVDTKIVLFGDRVLYYLLAAFDPDVSEHFKVLADFEDDVERSPANEAVHARLIASIVRRDRLRAVDREGVGLVLEHCARITDHAGKLTLLVDQIKDVLAEADFWAAEAKRSVVTRADVQRALDEKIRRASRLRDRAREAILQEIALIDTTGARVGQVNGLSVLELGGFRFGRPSRITCRVRPGSGRVVDIEREVELGGPIHSKGVLILSGLLAGRYALDTPMSLFASLVFEQSYGGVEGDSASSGELYALLSALAELPVRQDLGITGSVNQHGEIQAIGGVNEKIEGFFDICHARGLTGTQGVLIPKSNVQHLMLRQDVIDACAAGKFAIFPVATIDEGVALLAGRPAGERGADGHYPEGSVNRLVEDRLRAFAHIRQSFGPARLPERRENQS